MVKKDGGGAVKHISKIEPAKHASQTQAKPSSSSSHKDTSTSSTTHKDNVSLSSQAEKDAARQRIDNEHDEELKRLDEEKQAKEKALEEERIAKEKAIEEEKQARLKALEEEQKQKETELQAQRLNEQEKAAKEAALKAEMAAKKKALEDEVAGKKNALAGEIADKKAAIDAKYQAKISAIDGPALPPNFNEMSPEEQYNYLHDVSVAMAGGDESQWRTGEDELNIIGIRSFQNGQAVPPEGNVYNDTIYAVRMHDGKPEVYAFQGSVDAGVVNNPGSTGFGYADPKTGKYLGFSDLADGFYPIGTWTKGAVPHSGLGLRQNGDIKINVDLNNDGIIEDNERLGVTEGAGWGIQFHPGGTGDRVGLWSAGCQVIKGDQWGLFQNLISEDKNKDFAYTLVDSANLPPVDANHRAVGVPNTPVATGSGGTSISAGSSGAVTGTTDAGAVTSGVSYPVYAAPQTGSPLGASYTGGGVNAPFGPDAVDSVETGANIDQQLQSLCQAATQEIMAAKKGGFAQAGGMSPAVSALYFTYAQVLLQHLSIKPETEQMVANSLAMAGINVQQLKQVISQNAGKPM
ncbi:MAG: hypothetical protein M1536_01315 [Firmicutes bacterium]|nr:hypothetical protein [Bacillota bacterium]